ncbi:MAG: AI-2E family transporter [Myxococcota bacterium]
MGDDTYLQENAGSRMRNQEDPEAGLELPRASEFIAFARKVMVVVGLVSLSLFVGFVLWRSGQVLLVLFLGTLMALMIDGMAQWIQRNTRLPRPLAAMGVLLGMLAITVGIGVAIGPQLSSQFSDLGGRIDSASVEIRAWLNARNWGRGVLAQLQQQALLPPRLGEVTGAFSSILGAVTGIAGLLVITAYGAAEPDLYRQAALQLVPPGYRRRANEIAQLLARALRSWMIGRFTAMVTVGSLTWLGLFIVDMELAGALALIAGVFTFIPFIGPWLGAVPAVVVAFAISPEQLLGVSVVFFIVQFLETNLITPLAQRYAISFPPALLITVQLVMAATAGMLGVLVATPLVVAVVVLVQAIYVQDILGEDISIIGNPVATSPRDGSPAAPPAPPSTT